MRVADKDSTKLKEALTCPHLSNSRCLFIFSTPRNPSPAIPIPSPPTKATHAPQTFNLNVMSLEPSPSPLSSSPLNSPLTSPKPPLDLPKLLLISHAHSPPLNPVPQLRFDLRTLPNPPKRIRDSHVGTSRRLQEWMDADPAFADRRDEIREEILGAMDQMIRENEKGEVLHVDHVDGEASREDGLKSEFKAYEKEQSIVNGTGGGDGTGDENEQGYRRVYMEQDFSGLELRVGIVCAMGRHRSVAMVEELSRMEWPGWDVEVVHRDVAKKRGSINARSGGKGQRSRGSFTSEMNEDTE